jgi:hypothetical protein
MYTVSEQLYFYSKKRRIVKKLFVFVDRELSSAREAVKVEHERVNLKNLDC